MSGPMTGVRVVELGVWIAGPAAAGILADWGADVIKVEPPAGDPARLFHAMLGGEIPSNPVFELDNRSKRSVGLDLTNPEAHAIALDLIDQADVFISNMRPGALERLGFDYETLSARNPRLIYAAVTGYGMAGDDRDRAAFDIAAFWARSGIAAVLSPPDGHPPYQRGGMGDHSTAMAAAGAISAALFHRERTGEGQMVVASLMRQGMYTIGFDINLALGWGRIPAKATRTSMASPTVNHYGTSDAKRFWIVGLEGDRHWPPLARCVGHKDWLTDERFVTAAARHRNNTELTGLLDACFEARTLAEWTEVFSHEPDMFWSPVQDVDDLIADQQAWAIGGFVDVPGPDGPTTMVATPVDFAGTPWAPRGPAPDLGEHSRDILRELGHDEAAIDALFASGAAHSRAWFG